VHCSCDGMCRRFAGSLCDKAAVFIDKIKGTPCIYIFYSLCCVYRQNKSFLYWHDKRHALYTVYTARAVSPRHCNGSPDTPSSHRYFPRLLSISLSLTSHPITLSSKTCVYFPASVIIATDYTKDFEALTLNLSSSKLRMG
jgi:hypothetical protein